MHLFKEAERKETFAGVLDIDRSSWFQVFSACLGKMMVVQNACSELVVKGQNWSVDFSAGTILFDADAYPLQFIGSESSASNTWMWGWNNVNGFPEDLLRVAEDARRAGEKWKLEPLTTPEFSLDETFCGHNLSIVTCGLQKRCCYYRGPHEGGAIFVAFSDVPQEVFAPVDMEQFVSVTMQCLRQFVVDHPIFVESLLLWNGTPYEREENRIVAHFQRDLQLELEQAGEFLRVKSIKTL